MYFTTHLPLLPSEPVDAANAHQVSVRQQTFVDDNEVASVLGAWSEQQWTEQSFFGEDFAGREEFHTSPDEAENLHDILQGRVELGPFFSRPITHDNGMALADCRPTLKPGALESTLLAAQLRRRTITAASAAAALISAAMLGFLNPDNTADAPHITTDESVDSHLATGQPPASAPDWRPEVATIQEN